MPKALDLKSLRFGKLTALRAVSGKKRSWVCFCECGEHSVVPTNKLTSGRTKSCGCMAYSGLGNSTHGMSNTRVYEIWKDMRKRCNNPASNQYYDYGGRGIKVCKRWDVFMNFYEDMRDPPSEKHTIDRRNNDLGYSPDNCRWTTMTEQQRNRSNNHLLRFKGRTMCISAWAEDIGITSSALWMRIKRGWPLDRALQPDPEVKHG